jgi:ribulose-5-phosphate 4-epimerase/fuculose-1-phosphate aldolase
MKPRLEFEQLVAANRILAHEQVVDAFGHVSLQHPDHRHHYVLSRSRAPEFVKLDDLMEFELDGEPIDGQDRTPYGERFIHGAVMEGRPGINAVVHNHAYDVLPFGLTDTPIKPLIHTASVIGEHIPMWDIRDKFGDATDMLVRNMEQGRDLTTALDDNTCILMRGHGAVIAGKTIKEAVVASIYLMINARIQTISMTMGNPVYLSPKEIKNMTDVQFSPLAMDRMWEAFCLRAGLEPV